MPDASFCSLQEAQADAAESSSDDEGPTLAAMKMSLVEAYASGSGSDGAGCSSWGDGQASSSAAASSSPSDSLSTAAAASSSRSGSWSTAAVASSSRTASATASGSQSASNSGSLAASEDHRLEPYALPEGATAYLDAQPAAFLGTLCYCILCRARTVQPKDARAKHVAQTHRWAIGASEGRVLRPQPCAR